MDSLPIELLRLVFEYCDAPTARNLRLACWTLADVGYDYLLPPHFTTVSWRDDLKRLHSIAGHERLRTSLDSVTFNFSQVDEYNARHASFFQHWMQEPEERNMVLQDAWVQYYELEARSRALPSFDSRPVLVREALGQLPNLKNLEVTFTKCPYDIDVLKEVFQVRTCRKRDRAQAAKNMNVIISALRDVSLSSLSVDLLPLELFKQADDRRLWFDSARTFSSLSSLNLTLDPPNVFYPSARFRAINGLGHVLQFCPNLTSLSLAFHCYNAPSEKFMLPFSNLLSHSFTFKKLTDLKLEGIVSAEAELLSFLIRHGATLERLRLGGRGLAKPYEPSNGGIHLYQGSVRSFFTCLQGKLPKLQRFHLEGDVEAGEVMTGSREQYRFRAVTNEDWEPVTIRWRTVSRKTVECTELEKFLIHGGDFPSLAADESPE